MNKQRTKIPALDDNGKFVYDNNEGDNIMNMDKYFGQLVGCKIKGFHFEKDEWGGRDFPVFTLANSSEEIRFVISQDEEGNGGGFAFIEEIKQ